ncbi:universal stress protein [Nocardioides convexus]|uniref:universal stress protein n=1 Tax=Nocardioides convexus TaxID=2712224 RepID=UPI002418505C|nr:universal stress protein [Nocardioides convexus]
MSSRIRPGTIVVGADGSKHSDRALRWAGRQALLERRPLVVVTTEESTAFRVNAAAVHAVHEFFPGVEVSGVRAAGDPRTVLVEPDPGRAPAGHRLARARIRAQRAARLRQCLGEPARPVPRRRVPPPRGGAGPPGRPRRGRRQRDLAARHRVRFRAGVPARPATHRRPLRVGRDRRCRRPAQRPGWRVPTSEPATRPTSPLPSRWPASPRSTPTCPSPSASTTAWSTT